MSEFPSVRPAIDELDVASVAEALRSGHLEEGDYVREFEQSLAKFLSKPYGQATTNGFSAIHVLLQALRVRSGDEIILPSYCCPSVLYPIKLVGATPVFADIGPDSFNINLETISRVYSRRTRLVILPYHFGFPTDIDAIVDQFGQERVIEDIAQSLGVEYKGKQLGSYTYHAVASFYATKMITSGDGGMVFMQDEGVYESAKRLTYYGARRGHEVIGYNYHLTNLNAALGLSQFRKLGEFIARRKRIGQIYKSHLAEIPDIQTDFAFSDQAAFLKYPILLPNQRMRDCLKQRLAERKVQCGFGVLEPLHIKEGLTNSTMPNTMKFAHNILCLPIYPSMSDTDAAYVSRTLIDLYKVSNL